MCADVLLVSATGAIQFDEDLPLLTAALDRRGITNDVVSWDDSTVAWETCRRAVIRSTWDYSMRLPEFLGWAERAAAACDLVHGPPVLRWNTDKAYLLDLADVGVNIVESWFVRDRRDICLPEVGDYVVKPSVAAGSRDAARFGPGQREAATEHADRLLAAGSTVMVQPYQQSVDMFGETAMLFFGGVFSHAINKGPLLARGEAASRALYKQETISNHEPTREELDIARSVIDALAKVPDVGPSLSPPLYARVDLVRANDGTLAVLELELTEPSVFLANSETAAGRFADVIAARLPGN